MGMVGNADSIPHSGSAGRGGQYLAVEGRGLAAFTSLVWRRMKSGATFSQVPAWVPLGSYDDSGYAGVNGTNLEDLIVQQLAPAMGSCTLSASGGTRTPAPRFVAGADGWLASNKSPLHMASSSTSFGGNRADALHKASILRSRIGDEQGPVVANFAINASQSVYAPVAAYRVIWPYAESTDTPEVYVCGFDQGQTSRRWFALHDPWASTSGLFWIQ